MEQAERAKGIGTGTAALCCVPFLMLYVGFGQHTFYQKDGFQLVYNFLLRGSVAHDIHPLYLPVANAFAGLVEWTGLGLYRSLTLFSALCTAGGLFFVGLMTRRAGLGEDRAPWFVALVGVCPAVFFFATVIEFHAFFFLFACASFWLAERIIERSAVLEAAALGVLTFVAMLAHSSGNLLVPLLGAWIAARAGFKARLAPLAVFAAGHVALLVLVRPIVLEALGMPPRGVSLLTQWLGHWSNAEGLGTRAAVVFGREVMLHYLPLSLVVFVPFFVRGVWRPALWALAGFVPYYALCTFVLAEPGSGAPIHEWGSYLLPLAIPAAWILVRLVPAACPRRLQYLFAAGLALSLMHVVIHDTRPGRDYGTAIRATVDQRETLVVAGTLELPWLPIEAPHVTFWHAAEALRDPKVLFTYIDGALARHMRVLFTDYARQDLTNAAAQPAGVDILHRLAERYRLVNVGQGEFRANDVLAKP